MDDDTGMHKQRVDIKNVMTILVASRVTTSAAPAQRVCG